MDHGPRHPCDSDRDDFDWQDNEQPKHESPSELAEQASISWVDDEEGGGDAKPPGHHPGGPIPAVSIDRHTAADHEWCSQRDEPEIGIGIASGYSKGVRRHTCECHASWGTDVSC